LHYMKVKDWQGEIIFLHEVAAGAADRSYGIQVAKLAGLPQVVVERASQVLHSLEEGADRGQKIDNMADDLPLFSALQDRVRQDRPPQDNPAKKVTAALSDIHPDELSPRAALDILYQLKKLQQDG